MINTKCGLKKYGSKTKKYDKINTCLSENTLQLKYMEIIVNKSCLFSLILNINRKGLNLAAVHTCSMHIKQFKCK
jgi:hypothetical protein